MDNPTRLVAAAVDVFNRVGNLDQTIALIEASPELLAACRAMLVSDGLIGNQPNVLAAVQQMEAAIAKTQ